MGRVALVTGGSRGIGAAISKGLKEAGFKVAANYAGNDEAANRFKSETGIPVFKWSVADYDAWLRRAEHDRHVRFPAHEVEQALNDAVLQLTTRRFTRTDDALDARIEHIQALVHRVRRRF